MTTNRPPYGLSRERGCVAHVLALGLTLCGCALDEQADDATELSQVTDVGALDARVPSLDADVPADAGVRDAGGSWRTEPIAPVYPADYPATLPKIVAIRATGTGCPAGTVAGAVSSDGTSLTITFSEFEAVKARSAVLASKDCHLAITIKGVDAYAYTVERVFARGFAFLDRGVTAWHSVLAYAAGAALLVGEERADFTGPFDDQYTIEQIEPLIASCGYVRDLNVRSRLQVRRAYDAGVGGEGYLTLARVGRVMSGVQVKFSWRRCV